jgi:regulatory protein
VPQQSLALALRHLGRRERTEAEMRELLRRAGVGGEESDGVIEELVALGYLDDARYARLFVEDRRHLDGWGRARIARALRARGIEPELIGSALAEPDQRAELDRALALLGERFPGNALDVRDRRRAFGVLLRRGFDSELALEAIGRHPTGG